MSPLSSFQIIQQGAEIEFQILWEVWNAQVALKLTVFQRSVYKAEILHVCMYSRNLTLQAIPHYCYGNVHVFQIPVFA